MLIPPDVVLSVGGKLFELAPIPGSKEKHKREHAVYNAVIAVLSDLLAPYRFINTMSLAETKRVIEQVLEVINVITQRYLAGDKAHDLPTINSCYMVPILRQDFTDEILGKTQFVDRSRDLRNELRAVLALAQWAKPIGALPTEMYLPVEDQRSAHYQHLLFGAPWAFENGVAQFVDDTMRPSRRRHSLRFWVRHGPASPGRFFLPPELPQLVVQELTRYFRSHQHHVRSFVSMPLPIPPEDRALYPPEYEQQPLAVLNIHADQHRLLGKGGRRAQTLLAALVPVLNVLTRYISRVRLGAPGTIQSVAA